jgi:ABC-2 type transport system ATP-binding protein
VLISTHILPEVEVTCGRVLILYNGKIQAADTPENLQRQMSGDNKIVAEIAAPIHELEDCLAQIAEIERFDISPAEGEYFRCALIPRNGTDLRPQIYLLARERGWYLRELTRSRHSLEDIYVQLTQPDEEEEG